MSKSARRAALLILALFVLLLCASCGHQQQTAAVTSAQGTVTATVAPSATASPSDTAAAAAIASAAKDEIAGERYFALPTIVCRPTDKSITFNIVPAHDMKLYVEYGTESGKYESKTKETDGKGDMPMEIVADSLSPNTKYYYRVECKGQADNDFKATEEKSFMTQRSEGSTFTFCLQSDSHPERPEQFDPELYDLTLDNINRETPDFNISLGDNFSVDGLEGVENYKVTKPTITQIYINQRKYFGKIANTAPLFLINGNHEEANEYNYNKAVEKAKDDAKKSGSKSDNNNDSDSDSDDSTDTSKLGSNIPVWAQNARNLYYSQPAPDGFYTGDKEKVDGIGLLRDYYSFKWGDALFVIIDPYWHSPVPVNNVLGGGGVKRDLWEVTLGDEQYQWFKDTLKNSNAKYKFVFCHHVLGTQRGGVEVANLYEWGGYDNDGKWMFDKYRPNWDMTIQQVMKTYGVSIFFQGHDHCFVKNELDGVVYQTVPQPANQNYAAGRGNDYKSGVIKPDSGHLKVTVAPDKVTVDYIASVLPYDETNELYNGETLYSYTINPKQP